MTPFRFAMMTMIGTSIAALALAPAHASLTTVVSPANTPPPAGTINLQPTQSQVGTQSGTFANTAPLAASYSSSAPAEGVVQGNSSPGFAMLYSAPYNSPTTQITAPYFSTNLGTVTITLGTAESFLGILWGSVDTQNALTFFNGTTNLGTVTGSNVNAAAQGSQTYSGSDFVSITSSTPFTSIVASSTKISFEFADLAVGPGPIGSVPEPVSLSLLGVGLVGLGLAQRRRRA